MKRNRPFIVLFRSQVFFIATISLIMLACSLHACKSHSSESSLHNEGKDESITIKNKTDGGKGLHIVVEAPQRPIAGEAIWIKVILQNDSDEEITYGTMNSRNKEFIFEIENSAGALVPKTKYGQIVLRDRSNLPGSMSYRTLLPGKNHQIELNIARLFDLTIMDKYTISISRMVNEVVTGRKHELLIKAILAVQEPPISYEVKEPESMKQQ